MGPLRWTVVAVFVSFAALVFRWAVYVLRNGTPQHPAPFWPHELEFWIIIAVTGVLTLPTLLFIAGQIRAALP